MDEIERALGSIEGQLKGLNQYLAARDEHMDDQLAVHTGRLNNHSERIGRVERKHAWMLGGLAGLSAIGTLLLTRARDFLTGS